MDEAARQPQDHSEASDRRLPQRKGWKAGRAGIVRALSKLGDPLVEPLVRHQAKIRRWGGLGALALGIGLMAGGLEPIGLSLILLGTAVLLVDFERPQQGGSDRESK